jgi:hypothetical protein
MAERPIETANSFYALIGRALVDEDYRARIMDEKEQEGALTEALGRPATEADVTALRNSIEALDALYGKFGPRPYSA